MNAVLNCPMGDNDAGADTVREYLVALLATLWEEGEGFSGKRPFGSSSWEWDVYEALVKGGLVKGELDSDGYLADCDENEAHGMVAAAIQALR